MHRIFVIIIFTALLFTSCSKNHYDLITGVWEVVNVANINDPNAIDWEFREGNLIIYRRPVNSTAQGVVIDRGTYVINKRATKTTITLLDASTQIYNGEWDIVRMNEEQLIIKINIVGGIILREFVKKSI